MNLEVKDKYFLDVELPYYVNTDESQAKFEAKKATLKVKMPIDKSRLVEDPIPNLP